MREIIPKLLWVGNARDLRPFDPNSLQFLEAVVDLAVEELPAQLPRDVVYIRIPLMDAAGNAAARLRTAVEVVAGLLRDGSPTIVCCSGGMSRSPAIACVAMAVDAQKCPDEILKQYFADAPHDISPGLWSDLDTVFRNRR